MAQYLNKDDLVAEIERRMQESLDAGGATRGVYLSERMKEDSYILSFIDTLEVKEVDSLTPEEIKKICTIYDNLKQERECATILYNSDETFFNHVLMEYKAIAQKGE